MIQTKVTQADYSKFVMGLFFRNPGDLSKDFAHAVMGVASEVQLELPEEAEKWATDLARQEVEVLAELGDALFFHTAALHVLIEYLRSLDGECQWAGLATQSALDLLVVTRTEEGLRTMPGLAILHQGQTDVFGLWARTTPSLCSLQDVAKNWVGYGKKPGEAQVQLCLSALDTTIAQALGFSSVVLRKPLAEVLNLAILANIEKLKSRYPGGFSLEGSVNRDHEKEMEAVKGATTSDS